MTAITRWLAAALLIVLFTFGGMARAAEPNPLQPVDRSSPRAALANFVTELDAAYAASAELMSAYAASGRLYLSIAERERLAAARMQAIGAVRTLDDLDIFPAVRDIIASERTIQLKEILDRIGVPPLDTVPDKAAMAAAGSKRWRLPGTEIDFVLIETGPRAGQYLVSAETVGRLPEFYSRVKDLPYLPGPAKRLSDAYRALSGNQSTTIFEIISNSPIGLDRIIPTRWMVRLPDWLKSRVGDLAVWQWLGLLFGSAVCALIILAVYWATRRLARRGDDAANPTWTTLLTPAAIILTAHFVLPLFGFVFRVGGRPGEAMASIEIVAVYTSGAWIFLTGSARLGEVIAGWEHLAQHSMDSQLVLLGSRFVGIAIAAGLLLQAATELGFPAYSVLAGLGIGGLAFALAARDSLANLLGSVLIMFEKPFRIGHSIRVSGSEGVVEQVGFRSTRIRTSDNAVISIPNNVVVNATVENLSLRKMLRQRFLLRFAFDTPSEKIEAFIAETEKFIQQHPLTAENFSVRLTEISEHSLNVQVIFHLLVPGEEELREREKIIYKILSTAKELVVEFVNS